MKIAVIGSRTFSDYSLLKETLRCYYISEIVSGGDSGADKLAEQYARENNIKISVVPHNENPSGFYADRTFSIINMVQYVVAFWDGKSSGTMDLLNYARQKGKQVKIKYF